MSSFAPIQCALEALVAANRDAKSGEQATYRWTVLDADTEAGTIVARFTFLAGHSYCCYEPGCHVPLHSAQQWERLRRLLTHHGAVAPKTRLTVRLEVVVESGAEFHIYATSSSSRADEITFKATLREPSL